MASFKKDNICEGGCTCGGCFGKKVLWTLVGILLVYGIFYLGTLSRNTLKKYSYIGVADIYERQISVNGYGKVDAKNDVAVTTLGYSNLDKDVAKAQTDNKKVIDSVMSELRKMGFADKDLQTNYSIYPEYDYNPEGRTFKGYRVSTNLSIKVRNLNKVNAVLSLPGKYGMTEVSGLSFTIDDTEILKNQARVNALADAKEKAKTLAASLGVNLVEVVGYNEYEAYPQPVYSTMGAEKGGMGADVAAAPADISPGSKEVGMNVTVTYKIASPRFLNK